MSGLPGYFDVSASTLRVEVELLAPFPVLVDGEGGIVVSKDNGIWTIRFDASLLATVTEALAGDEVLVRRGTALYGAGVDAIVRDGTITNAKLADMPSGTIKGRASAGSGDPEDLTAAQAKTLLAVGIPDVSGLQTALDGKAASVHTHANATTTAAGFMSSTDKTKLDGVATGANNYVHPTGDGNSHVPITGTTNNGKFLRAGSTSNSAAWATPTIAEISGLQTALDGKAASVHTHTIGSVAGLQTALNGKAASVHAHTASQISDATSTGRAVLTAASAAAARAAIGVWLDVKMFGAVGDGVTDDTAAFAAALATSETIFVPPGTYRLTSSISSTTTRGLVGAGRGVSLLVWDDVPTSGIHVTHSPVYSYRWPVFTMQDLALLTKGRRGTALTVDYSPAGDTWPGDNLRFRICNVEFSGFGNNRATGWNIGLDAIAGAYGVVDTCAFHGWGVDRASGATFAEAGFQWRGIAPVYGNGHPVVCKAINCDVYNASRAVVFRGVEGGYVENGTFVEVDHGVYARGEGSARPHLSVTETHMNGYVSLIDVDDMVDVNICNNILYRIHTSTFDTVGIKIGSSSSLAGTGNYLVHGNAFVETGSPVRFDAIVINGGRDGTIDYNRFRYVRTAISLGSSGENMHVGPDNIYSSVVTSVSSASPSSLVASTALANPGETGNTSGITEKWGTVSVVLNANGDGVITFPSPFRNWILSATLTHAAKAYAPGVPVVDMGSSSNTTLAVAIRPNPGAVTVTLNYRAVGY